MTPEQVMNIGLLVALAAAGYFLFIRPARQKQKDHEARLNAMAVGDRVLTSIGIYGEVRHLGDFQAILEVSPGVEITVAKQILVKVVSPEEEEFEYDDEQEAEEVMVSDAVTGATEAPASKAGANEVPTPISLTDEAPIENEGQHGDK